MQAALQKDEDIVALTSYAKHDTTRITALRLEEKTASGELASLEEMLETEMSETQSYQIQLDRTAEEFRCDIIPYLIIPYILCKKFQSTESSFDLLGLFVRSWPL